MNRRAEPPRERVESRPASGGRAVDAFVVIAMGLVVFALATALNLQLGVDINVAVAGGAVVYAGLLAMHAFRRRKVQLPLERTRLPDFEPFDQVHDRLAAPGAGLPGRSDRSLSELEPPAVLRRRTKVAQVSLPPLAEHTGNQRAMSPAVAPGAVRPGGVRPYQPAPVKELAPSLPPPVSAAPSGGAGNLESDVERIQALVKKLANEINAADEAEALPVYGRTPRLPAEAAVDASVGALRQTADGMKAAAGVPAHAGPAPTMRGPAAAPSGANKAAVPPPLSPAQAHIAAVADSLVAGRVDVELEPILSLIDQRTSHYEVSVNVQGATGERLAGNNGFAGLQGTGLLPLFDSARLNRSVSIAQRLQERGKKGRVFSAYSIESLTNPSFLSDARAALQDRGSVGAQLVIGFQQADIRAFTPAEWAAVAELRHLHVVFAIDKMTHLDLDLKHLVKSGFAFARVAGAQFITGLRFGGRPVAGSELVRYITGAGVTLIVDHIDSEQQLQRLGQAGVQLGQGKVFGGRRPVKLSATKSGIAAA